MTIRRYELTISTNYVPNWTYLEAVRELFQNAIDAETVDSTHKMSYDYNPDKETLVIGNENTALDTASLLLGSSDKTTDKRLIGQHGEGYKIAFMVLLREGKKITVSNPMKGQLWSVYLKKTKKYGGEPVVGIKVDDKYNYGFGLNIAVEGITEEEWNDIVAHNLQLQEYPVCCHIENFGNILMDPEYSGNIYVNGLFIANDSSIKYGYDMRPGILDIDRDRRIVRTYDLAWHTSYMWKKAYVDWKEPEHEKYKDMLRQMLNDNVNDVVYISDRTIPSENKALAIDVALDFVKTYGPTALPVVDQSGAEEAKSAGRTPVIVSSKVKSLLDTVDIIAAVESETPIERLYAWYESVKDRLTLEEKVVFEDIYQKL